MSVRWHINSTDWVTSILRDGQRPTEQGLAARDFRPACVNSSAWSGGAFERDDRQVPAAGVEGKLEFQRRAGLWRANAQGLAHRDPRGQARRGS